ncbi:hypothetical protein G9A89_014495 [Geosiphon pyriformis]|nr:hypothetical protein G9A89_014495 [Geosiphon pyriformis]
MILIPENINNITQQLVESLQQLKSDLEITVNSFKITYIKRTIENPKTRKEHNFEPYNITKHNNKFISKVIEKLEIALGNTLIIEEIEISELTPDTFSNLKTKFPINYCYYQLGKHLNIQTLYSKDSIRVFDKTTIQLLESFIEKTNTTFHSKTVYRIFKAFENCYKLLLDPIMNIITTNSIRQLTNSQFQELQQQINNTVLNHYIDFSSASEKEYINTHNNQELKNNLHHDIKKKVFRTHERLIAIKTGYRQLNITKKPSCNNASHGAVVDDLKSHLVGIESSFVSLMKQISELAMRLELLMLAVSQPSPGWEDIVMGIGSDEATSDKIVPIVNLTASPHVVKLKKMLDGLFRFVLSLSAYFDSLALAGSATSLTSSQ